EQTGNFCIQFWHTRTLPLAKAAAVNTSILRVRSQQKPTKIYFQGQTSAELYWLRAAINVQAAATTKDELVLEHISGSSSNQQASKQDKQNIILVDDLSLHAGNCEPLDCNFDQLHPCGWHGRLNAEDED